MSAAFRYLLLNEGMFSGVSKVIATIQDEYFKLLTNLFSETNSNVVSFTRSSAETITDFEGTVLDVLPEEARFWYARRVHNIFYSEPIPADFSNFNAAFSAATTPISGFTRSIEFDGASSGGVSAYNPGVSPFFSDPARAIVLSVYVEMEDGSEPEVGSNSSAFNFALVVRGAVISPSLIIKTNVYGNVWRVSGSRVSVGQNYGILVLANQTLKKFKFTGMQLEYLSAITDPASELVSKNVIAFPYHGANVDGVEWFGTDRNGNALAGMRGIFIGANDEELAGALIGITNEFSASINIYKDVLTAGSVSVLFISDGTSNNTISLSLEDGKPKVEVTAGGVIQSSIEYPNAVPLNQINTLKIIVTANSIGLDVNGESHIENFTGAFPTGINTADIGHENGTKQLQGGVSEYRYYPSVIAFTNVPAYIEGSVYSGTKDTTSEWLGEKLASGTNALWIKDITQDVEIWWGTEPDSPSAMKTMLIGESEQFAIVGEWVAWRTVTTAGTITLEHGVIQ